MAEVSEYDKYNNPELANTGPIKPAKQEPIKLPKADNKYEALRQSGVETSVIGRNQSDVTDLDRGAVAGENIAESRAYNQTGLTQWRNGLIKGAGLAGTTIANTFVALPVGIIEASIDSQDDSKSAGEAFSRVYDNEYTQIFDAFNKGLEKSFPNYYTEKEQKASALSWDNVGTANFWSDKVLKNAGFTVGAIVGGGGISKGISKGATYFGKVLLGAKAVENTAAMTALIEAGMTPLQAAKQVSSTIPYFATKAQQLATGMIAAAGEGGMEAKQVKDELTDSLTQDFMAKNGRMPEGLEKKNIIDTASAAGNTTFAVNMAVLTASDLYQFNKLWSKGFKEEVARVGKIAVEDGRFVAAKSTIKDKILGGLKSTIPNALSEAAEEGTQTGTQAGTKEYYTRKYDKKGLTDTNDVISGMLVGLQETFGSKEGLESMLLGAVTGVGSHAVTSLISNRVNKGQPSEYDVANQIAGRLNIAGDKVKPFIDSLTRTASISKDQESNLASDNPSRLTHENLNNDLFKSIVQPFIETNRFDLLEDKLNDEYKKDEDKFREDNGEDVTSKPSKEYVAKLLKDAKKLKTSYETIQDAFPKSSEGVKQRAWSLASNIENRDERAKQLDTQLFSQTGVSYQNLQDKTEYLTKVQEAIDNGAVLTDIQQAKDVVSLFDEKRRLVEDYKRLLNPDYQAEVISQDEIQEEEKKAFEPEVKQELEIQPETTQELPIKEPETNMIATQNNEEGNPVSEPEIVQPASNSELTTNPEIAAKVEQTMGIVESLRSQGNPDEEIVKGLTDALEGVDDVTKQAFEQVIAELQKPKVEEKVEDSLPETTIEDLADAEIVANNDAVEELLSQEDVEAKQQEDAASISDYSEMNRMAATAFRSTANHEEAINEGLNSVIRYQNFVNNSKTSLVGLKLMVVTLDSPLYSKLQNAKQKAWQAKHPDIAGIMTVVVNSQGEIAIADTSGDIIKYIKPEELDSDADDKFQGALITTIAKATDVKDSGFNAVSYQHFGRVNGFGDKVTEEEVLDKNTPVGKAWSQHVEDLKSAREKMLKGEIKYLDITGLSYGIFQNTNAQNALGETLAVDVNSKELEFIVSKIEDITTPGFSTINVGGKEQQVRVGKPYVIYNGRLYPLQSRKLNAQEVDNVQKMFELAISKPDRQQYFLGKIKELVFINPNTRASILSGELEGEDLKEYLSSRYRQVDANKLDTNPTDSYEISSVTDKGVNNKREKTSYRDFVLGGEGRVLSVNFNPHPTTVTEAPNYLNGYLEYTPVLENIDEVKVEISKEEQVSIQEVINKPATKGKRVYKPITVEDEGLLRRVSLAKSNTKEDLDILKKWFEDRFDGESFEVVDKLINGNGFGEYTAAGIKLFSGAEIGTGYHEAFHKVTQEYLTPKQLKSLYDDVRKSVNKSKMSDFEAEEYLAEDFRNFMLSGQKAIKNRPATNNIFRKLYNYLRSLFTGKTTPEQIYNKLASKKGFTGAKKFNVQQFTRLGRTAIEGLTHAQTKNIVESVNAHFFNILFDSKKTPDQILGKEGAELVNKAYSIVFKRLVNRDFGAFVRDADEYSDEEYNAIADHYDFLLNIVDGEPTSLNQLAIQAHKDYLKGLGIYLGEEIGIEQEDLIDEDGDDTNLEGTETDRSRAEWSNSNEENTLYSTPNSIKLLVMSIPKIDADGNPVANNIGGPALNDYKQTLSLLYSNLNGLTTYEDMWNKLEQIAPRFPVFRELMKRLGEPGTTKSFEQFLLEQDFRQAFAKFESQGTVTLINKETGAIYQVDANANKLKDRIKEIWTSNLRVLAQDKDSYIKKGDDGILRLDESFIKDARAGKFKGDYKQLLHNLGVDFTDLSKEQVQTLPNITETVNAIFKYLAKAVEEGKSINDLFSKDADIRGRMDSLLAIEQEYSKETVELSYINAEGKRIYAVSLNNFYSLTINHLNNAKTLDELFKAQPHLNNPYTRNSVWLKNMFDKSGNKIPGIKAYMNTQAGLKIQNDNESGVGATKMEPADKIVQEFNDLLTKGTTSLIRPADKSSEYPMGITKYGDNHLAIPLEDISKEGFETSKVHEIFYGYFQDELARIRAFNGLKDKEGKWIRKPIGQNIAIYSKQAGNFSLFADILSSETLKELEPYKTSDEELSVQLEAKINTEVVKYLGKYAKSIKDYMQERKVGLPNGKGFTGISTELASNEKELNNAIKTFAVNHLVQMVEQSKLMIGDSAFFKDKIKRISGGSGNKKFAASSPSVNTWLNGFYKNEVGRVDGKVADGLLNAVIFDDVKAVLDTFEDYVQALVSKGVSDEEARTILDAYTKMDEGDAQGWITLDEYREFMMRVGGAYWTAEHEKQFRYELALEAQEKGQQLTDWQKSALELGNPNFYFMPIKAQYFGPQVMDGLYAPAFHKYSLAPLYHSLVKGRNMEELLNSMRENKVGYALFGSGSKIGTPLNSQGKLPSFYGDNGIEGITDNTPIQQIYYENLGIQLDIAPKVKDKIIFGSQFRKLLFSNLFGENAKEWAKPLADEYNKLIDNQVEKELNKLIGKLGIERRKDGVFTFNGDYSKLVEQLRENLQDKDTADNILDSLQTNEDGSLKYPIDALVNRSKIENMLFSIVNNKVIKQKTLGNALVQLASSGFEPKGKREVGTSNYLKFYERGKDKTFAMEVEIPINDTFAPLLKKYGTIDALNKAIEEGKVNQKYLTMVGYRIPTQGLNSMDVMTIKRFMPSESGIAIILPTGVVAKSGGDYDIDKLNIFMPNLKGGYSNDLESREGIQNRILEIASEVLSHPDNFIDLTTPNTTDTLVNLTGDIREARGESRGVIKASTTKEFRFDFIMEQFTYFLGGKAALGVAATHNTHHILSQIANVTFNIDQKDFPFKANFTETNTVNKKEYIREIYKVAISNLNKEEVDKYLTANKKKLDMPQAQREEYLYSQFGWLFDGEVDEIQNIRYSLTDKAINDNYDTALSDYNNKIAAQADITIANRIAKGILEMYDGNQNFNNESKVDLSKQYTQGGQKISDLISQFINAYVDVAKDPFYKDLNAGTEVVSIWMYLIRAGVDVKTIGYFMTQPAIIEYVNAKKLNNSLAVESAGRKVSINKIRVGKRQAIEAEIIQLEAKARAYEDNNKADSNRLYKEANALQYLLDNKSIEEEVLAKYGNIENSKVRIDLTNNANETLLFLLKQGAGKEYDVNFRNSQTYFLQQFLEIEKQADALTKLMQVTNSDTKTTRSFGSQFNEAAKRSEVENNGLIHQGTANRIREQTIVGSFDKGLTITQLFKELSLYKSRPEVEAGLNELINQIDKKADFEKEYTKIQNDFAGYLTQMYSKTLDGKPLYSKMNLFSGDNSLAKQLIQLNKEELLSENPFTQELIAQVSAKDGEIDNIKMYSRRITAFESNVISEAFRELLESNDPRLAEFGRDLMYFTILQSGLNNSPITFTELIPFEYYGDLVKGAIDSAVDKGINVQDFQEKYYQKQNSKYGFRLQDFGISGISEKSITQNGLTPKGRQLQKGVYINQEGLTKEEQLEVFELIKPLISSSAAKTNKGANANYMMGLGLRWDYKSNNPNLSPVNVGNTLKGMNTPYGYYKEDINGKPLGEIPTRLKELISKASGVDISDYDGAIINIYTPETFISKHTDQDESSTAGNYPVVAVNIGGNGNFEIGNGSNKGDSKLNDGAAYVFGFKGYARQEFHFTTASDIKGFLPAISINHSRLQTNLKEGNYRITITMRRVMPLTSNMPIEPSILSDTATLPKISKLQIAEDKVLPQQDDSNVETTDITTQVLPDIEEETFEYEGKTYTKARVEDFNKPPQTFIQQQSAIREANIQAKMSEEDEDVNKQCNL